MKSAHNNKSTSIVSAVGLVIPVIVFVLISICIYCYVNLNSKSPQNLTKKAPVFKKTYIISSQQKCFNGSAVKLSVDNKIFLPIIMYHYVEYVKDLGDIKRQKMNIKPAIFEEQVKSLIEGGYKTIFMKEAAHIIKQKRNTCEPTVALTFDDGYEDFYLYVFPILKKYNAKATLYVISNYIGRNDFLSEDELNEIVKSGLVEIGSHTMDHIDLWITNNVGSEAEIMMSKTRLQDQLKISVDTFAYPFGKYKPTDIDLVKQASYSAAVTVRDGAWHTPEDLFYLSRIRPEQFIGKNIASELKVYSK